MGGWMSDPSQSMGGCVRGWVGGWVTDLEDVCAGLGFLLALGTPRLDHLGEETDHFFPGSVAFEVGGDGKVGEEDGDGRNPLVEVVVELGDLRKELLAHIIPMQAAGSLCLGGWVGGWVGG